MNSPAVESVRDLLVRRIENLADICSSLAADTGDPVNVADAANSLVTLSCALHNDAAKLYGAVGRRDPEWAREKVAEEHAEEQRRVRTPPPAPPPPPNMVITEGSPHIGKNPAGVCPAARKVPAPSL